MDRTAHGTYGVVTCREAALALIKVMHATESHVKLLTFQEQMAPLLIDGSEQIPEMVAHTQDLPLGSTHCDRPMLWALAQQEDFDVFVILTDYDVGWQKDRDFSALQRYRLEHDVPHARLVVVGLKSTQLDLACGNDAGVLGICGFGAPVLDIIQQFALEMIR
ncbi:CBN-ROP-1 protein [Aphelenchoides avenae]|nr:CBN-ROP-1 protein [Aphelenchus avenae]